MSKQLEDSSITKSPSFSSNTTEGIVEVYQDNFVKEIKHLSSLLDKYSFIGMDTEFPGTVYWLSNYSKDFYYKTVKLNVDSLKLIQLGITLTNEKGEKPEGIHTWQFNLKFNYKKEAYSSSSFSLLCNCGLDFDKLQRDGIPHELFAEYLITSGLVLNDDLTWVCYHGSYDFGFLLKTVTNLPLPVKEEDFTEQVSLYFPNIYDIKILTKGIDYLQGGLNKLGNYLDVLRKGMTHQAGSDSILTIDVYFKLFDHSYIEKETVKLSKDIIFGIGLGTDENETLSYTKIGNFMGYDFMNNVSNYYPYPITMEVN